MSFAPPGESAADLWAERSLFAGTMLGCVSFGIHLCIFATTLHHMLRARARSPSGAPTPSRYSFLYISLVFALGVLQLGGNVKYFEKMWIDDRDVPGGPVGWYTDHFGDPVNTFASGAYIVANLLQDGMLLYRLLVVWNFKYIVAVVPFLALLASTALSILVVFQSAKPGSGLWSTLTISVAVPYFSISIGLNILMTLAIAGRMLYMRRRVVAVLGAQHARLYTGIASMFVESGAVYSALGLVFLVCYARGSNVQNLVLQSLDQAVCISPELIMLRVALGRAWSRDTTALTTNGSPGASVSVSVQFARPTVASSRTAASGRGWGRRGGGAAQSSNADGDFLTSRPDSIHASAGASEFSKTFVNRSASDVDVDVDVKSGVKSGVGCRGEVDEMRERERDGDGDSVSVSV